MLVIACTQGQYKIETCNLYSVPHLHKTAGKEPSQSVSCLDWVHFLDTEQRCCTGNEECSSQNKHVIYVRACEFIQTVPEHGNHCIFKNILLETDKSFHNLLKFVLFSGVVHHDDQMYLFFISALFPQFKREDPETKIVERQTKMWANFVQTG
jgi:hypothetical protein